jgi:hypothetical protein
MPIQNAIAIHHQRRSWGRTGFAAYVPKHCCQGH